MEPEVRPVNLSRLCRMCAEPCTIATSTDVLAPNPKLVSQLLHYFGILLLQNDGLPTRICLCCTRELERWEQVKETVQKGQDFLCKQLELMQSGHQVATEPQEEIVDYGGSPVLQTTEVNEPDWTPTNETEDNSSLLKTIAGNQDETETLNLQVFDDNDIFEGNALDMVATEDMEENAVSSDEDSDYGDPANLIECELCKDTFRTQKRYLKHKNDIHSLVLPLTKGVSRNKTIEVVNNRPKRDMSPTRPYACGLCHKKYEDAVELIGHLNQHISFNQHLKLIPCPYCKLLFKKQVHLIDHLQHHIRKPDGKLSFPCDVCKKEFANRSYLKNHQKSHTGVKNFKCPYCPIKFNFKCQINAHCKTYHQKLVEKVSDTLPTQSESSSELKCGFCDTYFTRMASLIKHLITEHDKGEYANETHPCGNCTAQFRLMANLLLHLKVHLPAIKTRFVCQACLKSFTSQDHLYSHMKTVHTNKIAQECRFCKSSFENLDDLTKHTKEAHSDKPIEVVNHVHPKRFRKIAPQPSTSTDPIEITTVYINPETSEIIYSPPEQILTEQADMDAIVISIPKEPELEGVEEERNIPIYFCRICDKDLETLDNFTDHVTKLHELQKKLVCGPCNAPFRKLELLINHLKKHENFPDRVRQFTCDVCNRNFHNRSNFRVHMFQHNQHKRFRCRACERSFTHKISWKSHVESAHQDFPGHVEDLLVYIPVPGSWIDKNNSLGPVTVVSNNTMVYVQQYKKIEALLNSTDEANYKCGVCNRKFTFASDFEEHSQFEMKLLEEVACSECEETFKKAELLVRHVVTSHIVPCNTTSFECESCSSTFGDLNAYVTHLETHKNLFRCQLCDIKFSCKSSWTRHRNRIHPDCNDKEALEILRDVSEDSILMASLNEDLAGMFGESEAGKEKFKLPEKKSDKSRHSYRYPCEICKEKFFDSRSAFIHILSQHVDADSPTCPVCSGNFETAELRDQHLQSHVERKYMCNICDRAFKHPSTRDSHVHLHSTERKFKCKQCDRTYRAKQALYVHVQRDHNKVRSFMCEFCSQLFYQKADLRKHIRRKHSIVKPYVCDQCGKGYLSQRDLKLHLYSHTDFKPLACIKCPKRFLDYRNWRNHMRYVCKIPEEDIPYKRPRAHYLKPKESKEPQIQEFQIEVVSEPMEELQQQVGIVLDYEFM